ncbi:MAG: type 2 isopentenyl-diphosphate Delta-isomerase [Clostridia bacterium]|nr:type 2 isopentenyl-diphosphate Delta-isomerase [Clostridia bacterium]
MKEIRENRKLDHIEQALKSKAGPLSPGWEDIHLVHQAVVNSNIEDVNTSITLFDKKLAAPIIINAITGGAEGLEKINCLLAEIAKEFGLGMAVGSQTAGVMNINLQSTYKIAREKNPTGLIFANVSADVKPKLALDAIEMIEADALQLHLNSVQELAMKEGNSNFRGLAENIQSICQRVSVPVIVKEVGNGISQETARKLAQLGIRGIDTGGSGGTNFASIELARFNQQKLEFLKWWGISSAISLIETTSLGLDTLIFASGGITQATHVMKALSLGADAVGIAGSILDILINKGMTELKNYISNMLYELKIIMLLTGAKNIDEIKKLPVVVTGFTREWCEQRHVEVSK